MFYAKNKKGFFNWYAIELVEECVSEIALEKTDFIEETIHASKISELAFFETMEGDVKTLELDKICRVCLTVKKDMRPLFGEMVAEMLMECTRIQVKTKKNTKCTQSFNVNIW